MRLDFSISCSSRVSHELELHAAEYFLDTGQQCQHSPPPCNTQLPPGRLYIGAVVAHLTGPVAQLKGFLCLPFHKSECRDAYVVGWTLERCSGQAVVSYRSQQDL